MTTKGDLGKWAEGEVMSWLNERADLQYDFAFHRFPDARAARGALGKQPSDFLVAPGWGKQSFLFEVKETAQKSRLPIKKIRQYGKMKMFHAAGMGAAVLVYASVHKGWAILGPDELCFDGDAPLSFELPDVFYPTHNEALNVLF